METCVYFFVGFIGLTYGLYKHNKAAECQLELEEKADRLKKFRERERNLKAELRKYETTLGLLEANVTEMRNCIYDRHPEDEE